MSVFCLISRCYYHYDVRLFFDWSKTEELGEQYQDMLMRYIKLQGDNPEQAPATEQILSCGNI